MERADRGGKRTYIREKREDKREQERAIREGNERRQRR
jgi:hypothetical protein